MLKNSLIIQVDVSLAFLVTIPIDFFENKPITIELAHFDFHKFFTAQVGAAVRSNHNGTTLWIA